jgi:hypothetical protein
MKQFMHSPNHPTQSTKTPKVAKLLECPGMGFGFPVTASNLRKPRVSDAKKLPKINGSPSQSWSYTQVSHVNPHRAHLPMKIAAIIPATPPTICTGPHPAKSTTPLDMILWPVGLPKVKNPPPQTQCATNG